MIHFFRDILDGPLYVVVAILALIFIIAIIGFMMERKQLEREKRNREAVLSDTPIGSVAVNDVTQFSDFNQNENVSVSPVVTSPTIEEPISAVETPVSEGTISNDNIIPEIKIDNVAVNDVPSVLNLDEVDNQ